MNACERTLAARKLLALRRVCTCAWTQPWNLPLRLHTRQYWEATRQRKAVAIVIRLSVESKASFAARHGSYPRSLRPRNLCLAEQAPGPVCQTNCMEYWMIPACSSKSSKGRVWCWHRCCGKDSDSDSDSDSSLFNSETDSDSDSSLFNVYPRVSMQCVNAFTATVTDSVLFGVSMLSRSR